jgi:hypothetical protein
MNQLLNPVFLLVLSSAIIGLLVLNQQFDSSETMVNKVLFNILSLAFLMVFVLHGYKKGTTYGLYITLFLWAFFVCTVPIPQVALLLSFPLKHFFDITMITSQVIISFFAIVVLVYFHFKMKSLLQKHDMGKMFQDIMKHRLYFIFVLSVIGSVIGSYLIDSFVDIYVFRPEIKQPNEVMRNVLLSVVLFILLNIWYMNYSKKHGLSF